jgi:hypothetical protein
MLVSSRWIGSCQPGLGQLSARHISPPPSSTRAQACYTGASSRTGYPPAAVTVDTNLLVACVALIWGHVGACVSALGWVLQQAKQQQH